MVVRERPLKIGEVGPGSGDKTADIVKPISGPSLLQGKAFQLHPFTDQFGNAGSCRPGAQKESPLVAELFLLDAQGTIDSGQRDSGRSLDVIVESADGIPVAGKDGMGVEIGEV